MKSQSVIERKLGESTAFDSLLEGQADKRKPNLKVVQFAVKEIHKRAKLKFPVDPKIVLQQFSQKPYDIFIQPMERDAYGLICQATKGNEPISVFVVNQNHNKAQRRFTLAHLAAHHFWHPEETHVDKAKQRMTTNEILDRPSTADIEANEFARCLLMPTKEIHHWIDKWDVCYLDDEIIEDMSRYFGVSQISMVLRLQQIGVIRQDTLL